MTQGYIFSCTGIDRFICLYQKLIDNNHINLSNIILKNRIQQS